MKLFKRSIFIISITFLFCLFSNAQQQNYGFQSQNDFWEKVRFGGAFGLGIGSNYTEVTIAPSTVYPVNEYFETGIGVQGTYVDQKPVFFLFPGYKAYIYGGSLIGLINPIKQIQLSAEVEQLRINVDYSNGTSRNFWNTALFVGAGYRTSSFLTIGVKYNVLHNNKNNIYKEPLSPFVRIYF